MAKKRTNVKELFSLESTGVDFYGRSGTMMSPIYEAGSFQRADWGLVQCWCREGWTVTIRPATDDEQLWAFKQLAEREQKMRRL